VARLVAASLVVAAVGRLGLRLVLESLLLLASLHLRSLHWGSPRLLTSLLLGRLGQMTANLLYSLL
jgi:hypothetical protein